MTVKEAGMGLPAKVGHRAFADWLGTAHQYSFKLRCPAFFVIESDLSQLGLPQIKDFNLFLMKFLL
jgi:hypothetical protein